MKTLEQIETKIIEQIDAFIKNSRGYTRKTESYRNRTMQRITRAADGEEMLIEDNYDPHNGNVVMTWVWDSITDTEHYYIEDRNSGLWVEE